MNEDMKRYIGSLMDKIDKEYEEEKTRKRLKQRIDGTYIVIDRDIYTKGETDD